MSAGVFVSSVGALVRGSHGAGTMQNATNASATVNVSALAAGHAEVEQVLRKLGVQRGRLLRVRWGRCGGQHALRRDIRINVNNNMRHARPYALAAVS
jgi:hypothetical protein